MSGRARRPGLALPSTRVLAAATVVLLGVSVWVGSYWDGHCVERTTGSSCTATGYGIIVTSCLLFALAATAALVVVIRLVRGVSRR